MMVLLLLVLMRTVLIFLNDEDDLIEIGSATSDDWDIPLLVLLVPIVLSTLIEISKLMLPSECSYRKLQKIMKLC